MRTYFPHIQNSSSSFFSKNSKNLSWISKPIWGNKWHVSLLKRTNLLGLCQATSAPQGFPGCLTFFQEAQPWKLAKQGAVFVCEDQWEALLSVPGTRRNPVWSRDFIKSGHQRKKSANVCKMPVVGWQKRKSSFIKWAEGFFLAQPDSGVTLRPQRVDWNWFQCQAKKLCMQGNTTNKSS